MSEASNKNASGAPSSTVILLFVVFALCLVLLLVSPSNGSRARDGFADLKDRPADNFADSDGTSGKTAVRDVRKAADAEALLNSPTKGLLMIHAPWCGHCKNMMPAYEEAAQELLDSGSASTLARIQAEDAGGEFMNKHGVRGFPTLIVLGGTGKEFYEGGRSKEALLTFVRAL